MTLARASLSVAGWLGAIVFMLNAMALAVWGLIVSSRGFIAGAFAMIAAAFIVAGTMSAFERRYRREPPDSSKPLWILAGGFVGVLLLTLIITAQVTLASITR
jgi:hypothetical protein